MSELNVRRIQPDEYKQWDQLVNASTQGTLFHSSLWQRVIESSYGGGELEFLGAFSGSRLVGGSTFLHRKRMRQETAVTPLMTPYVGFLLRDEGSSKLSDKVSSSSEILTALATRLCSQYSYQLLSNSPQLQDTRPLQNLGYIIQPRYTYVLDLRPSTDELWNSFDGHVRRQIKKAEKVGFTLADEIVPEAAYRLFRETFVRRGEKCPVAKAFLAELACGSILQHNRTVIVASLDSQVVAYIVLLKFKDTAYYSVASTAADHLQSGVSSLLIWKAIKALQADCINSLDLVGANIPSIARFKEGFNPELRTFYQAEYFSGVHVKLGKKISRVISR